MTVFKIFYYLATTLFVGFMLLSLFIIIFSSLSLLEVYSSFDIPFVEISSISAVSNEVDSVLLKIPIIDSAISFPINEYWILLPVLIALFFYSSYFFYLKEFFGIFIQQKSFTKRAIKNLKIFGLLNFVPIIYWATFAVVYLIQGKPIWDDEFWILPIHFVVGLVSFLFIKILKQGVLLQQEQDLTI